MADWQNKLNIRRIWEQATAREITPQQLCEGVAKAIKAHRRFAEDESMQHVHEAFVAMAENPEATWNDTDAVMQELYDWGDTVVDANVWPHKKKCWIATVA